MEIKIQKKIKSKKGILFVPIAAETVKKIPSKYPKEVKDFIKQLVKTEKFKAKKYEIFSTYISNPSLPPRLAVVGIGSKKKQSVPLAKNLGGKIGKFAKANKTLEVSFMLPGELKPFTQEFVEGVIGAQYDLEKRKKHRETNWLSKLDIVIEGEEKELKPLCKKAEHLMYAAAFVKDLVNAPSNVVDQDFVVREAKKIAKDNKYKITVLGEKELKKQGWGGVLAVNQGSEKQARCVILEYNGAKNKKEAPIVLVGKGVIFDTGGYNLKPTRSIEEMHQDMAGAATVLGVFKLLKKLKIKKNVIGLTPLVENLVSATSYRPSDIITMLSGKTVEVTNTDAEGRLILADAIFRGTKFKPQNIITVATLTGAAGVAVGDRYAALIGNNIALRRKLRRAGREVDEWGWPLPLPSCYKKKMDSSIADIRNYDVGSGRYAGASKGAAFLERFVEKNKWCHIDIGGAAFTKDPKSYQTRGATAHGMQMLVRFLENEK